MADQPQSFGQWIQQNASKYPALTSPSAQGPDFSSMPKLPGQPDGPGDVLSSLVDIISRPLFGVTEMIDSTFDSIKEQPELQRRYREEGFASGLGMSLEQFGRNITAPIRGVFSTNKDDKRTFSDLIESGTDAIGGTFNQNYEDVQDNVNPVLKGGLGLVGDIFADPLTYTPAALLSLPFKLAGKAIKGAGAVEDAVLASDNIAEAATSQAFKPQLALESGSTKFEADAAGNVARDWEGNLPEGTNLGAPIPKPAKSADEMVFEPAAQKIAPGLRTAEALPAPATPAGPVARVTILTKTGESVQEFATKEEAAKFVEGLKAQGLKMVNARTKKPRLADGEARYRIEKVADAPETAAPGALAAVQQAVGEAPVEAMSDLLGRIATAGAKKTALTPQEWMKKLREITQGRQLKMTVEFPGGVIKELPLPKAYDVRKQSVNPTLIEATVKRAYEEYLRTFAKRPIDVQGTPLGGVGDNSMERFWAQLTEDPAAVEMILGAELLDRLKRVTNPETFETYVRQMQSVLKATGALDDAKVIAPGSIARQMLERVGIDPDTYAKPAVVAATKHVAEAVEESLQPGATPEKIAEAIKTMSDEMDALAPDSDQARILGDVSGALEEVVRKNIDEPLKESGPYSFESGTGVKRTDDDYSLGLGADVPFANTYLQWDLFAAITKRVTARVDKTYKNLKDKPLAGAERAKVVEREALEAMRYAERFLIAERAPLHFDLDGQRIALTFHEVYELLAKADPAVHDTLRMVFFNAGTAIAPTKFMEAVVSALRPGATADDILSALASVEKRNSKIDGKPIESFFEGADAGAVNYGYYGFRPLKTGENIHKPPVSPSEDFIYVKGKSTKGWEIRYSSTQAAQKVASAIAQSRNDLLALSVKNSEAYAKQLNADTMMMTDEVLERLSDLGNTPAKMAEAFKVFGKPEKMAKSVYDEGPARRRDAAKMAEIAAKAAVPEPVQEAAEAAVKQASAVRQGRSADAAKVSQRAFEKRAQQDAVRDEQLRIARGLPADDTLPAPDPYATRLTDEAAQRAQAKKTATQALDDEASIGDATKWTRDAYAGIKSGIMRFLDPLDRIFNAKAGMTFKFGQESLDLYHLRHRFGILSRSVMVGKIRGLRKLEKDYGDFVPGTETSYLAQAFKHLQKRDGLGTPTEPRVLAAYKELEHYMSDLLGVPGKLDEAVLGNAFFRNNPVGLTYLNDTFGAYQVLGKNTAPDTIFFDIDKAASDLQALKAQEPNTTLDLMSMAADQWRDWDVKDPVEFMSRLNAAAIAMATDTAVSQSFVQMAQSADLVSNVPRAGYARLTVDGKSKYGGLIHAYVGDNVYYPKELISALRRMDEVARTSKGLDSELGKFIQEVFDPIQNTWKYAITLPRPGHHIRNFVGDSSMTYLAEGLTFYARAGKDAFKVMSLRNNYTGVDVMRSINQLGIKDLPKTGDVISSGKYGDLTADGILDSAMKDGILPPAHVIEDVFSSDELLPGVQNALSTTLEKAALRGGKIEDTVAGVSEYRDHYSRLQHYIQFIHKAQKSGAYRSREEMLEAAAKQVLKWHPDVSLLSVSEAKYARRLMPFYSWFRGAVPAIAESLVLNPARFNMFNKASYNIAVAMGVNPDTLYDPFPEDQLFPTFLTEQMEGPQFQIGDAYFRLNPGIATWDVSNMLGPDPIRGIAGATSPLLRVPAELLAGGSWGTGARINDASDYLDASIPGVNYAANFTGTSVTGSLMSLLQGRGLDPQFQVAAGNKGPADQGLSALNWLTGAGLQNFSKPNYINYAEIERRNAEGEQRGF